MAISMCPSGSPIFLNYHARLLRVGRSKSTIDGFLQAERDFFSFCYKRNIPEESVTSADIDEWSHQPDKAPSTRRLWWDHIRAAYRFAHEDGLVASFPFARAEPPRIPEKEPRVIPTNELLAMSKECVTERENLIYMLATYTGMRFSEMQNLKWGDVRYVGGHPNGLMMASFEFEGKQGKRRTVPIHSSLRQTLNIVGAKNPGDYIVQSPRGGMLSESSWRNDLRRITHGKYAFHDFRRTVTTALYEAGVDDAVTDLIMGWSKKSIRDKHYRRVPSNKLHEAIEKIYRPNGLQQFIQTNVSPYDLNVEIEAWFKQVRKRVEQQLFLGKDSKPVAKGQRFSFMWKDELKREEEPCVNCSYC